MRHPPTIVQEVVALFFQLGHYDSHLRNIERRYKQRWHVMNDAITQHLTMLRKSLRDRYRTRIISSQASAASPVSEFVEKTPE